MKRRYQCLRCGGINQFSEVCPDCLNVGSVEIEDEEENKK